MNTSVKVCTRCKSTKENSSKKWCEKCLKVQRDRRRKTKDRDTKKYEATPEGKLMRTYRNMKSRVVGVLKNKRHLYEGLEILDKKEFYKWSMEESNFMYLYRDWVFSGCDLKLSPSIDRIDPEKGYVIGNIQWLTFSQNCSRIRGKSYKRELKSA